MRSTPLESTVVGRGAVLGEDGGWRVALSYGDTEAETSRARTAAVVADVSHWGAFTLEGKNAVKFLQGLVTNDVAGLEPGRGCYAAFLNVHGRIEAVAHVFSLGENRLFLRTPPEATSWVATSLGRFKLAGGFDLVQLDEHASIALAGPLSSSAIARVVGDRLPSQPRLRCEELQLEGARIWIAGIPRGNVDSVDLVGPTDVIAKAIESLLVDGDVSLAGADALDVLAMEAGIARFGRDFDAETVLQEADLPDVVSFTKGCYLGQEIVARIHYQGQPSKLLRRLLIDTDVVPSAGDEIVPADEDAKAAGRVTSAVRSAVEGTVAFGVVKRRHYAPDTALRVRHGDAFVPVVVAPRSHPTPVQETR